MFCTKCGAFNDEGAKFCGACGSSLEVKVVEIKKESDQVYQAQMQNGKSDNRKKKGAVIAAAAVILIALIAAGFLALRGVDEKSRYDDLLASGNKFYEEMDYEAAEAVFLEAISINPKKADAYLMLADVYVASGETEKAEDILDDAEENVTDNEAVIEKIEEIKGYVKYEWVVEPEIEADNIYYVKEGFDVIRNDEHKQWMQEYAVIEKDGRRGLIDLNGQMLGGMDYASIHCYYETLLLYRIEPIYETAFDTEWYLYGLEDGKIQMVDGIGGGFPGNIFYCANGNLINYLDIYGEEREYFWNYTPEPVRSMPIVEFDHILTSDEFDKLTPFYDETYRYGIWSDGQMKSGLEYEQCGSFSSGLFAAKKDGKWGYINENGETVIPFEYDESWNRYEIYINDNTFADYAYSASDGFVVLNKDGRWSMRNTEGNLVIPEGIFEQICPVYQGKCWVKQNGKWGVIELVLPKGKKIDNDPVDFAACVENMASDPLQVLEAQDYDSDGRIEAFAITGGFPDENGIYYPAQIWFVDADGNCTLIEGDTYGMVREQVVAGEHTFFVWEMTAMGSSSCSFIYGVKNGEYYSSDISGMYGSFGGFDGNYSAIADNWDSGYHQYDAVYFEFQEDEFIEIGREENVW